MSNGSKSVCGTCQHWRATPRNTMNLSEPQRGHCQQGPPHTTTIPGPNGQMATFTSYPDLPADFPACSQHSPQPVEIAGR